MRQIIIMLTTPHNLDPEGEEEILGEYIVDDNRVLMDVQEWQHRRYANMVSVVDLIGLPPSQFVTITIQMLWERRMYGYPYKPFQPPYPKGFSSVELLIGIKVPPKPQYGRPYR